MKWPIDVCRVVGGMRPTEGKAPFARGAAVLERAGQPGSFLQARGYAQDGADGDELDQDEWDALQASRQAMSLMTPVPATAHAALWIMRPSFEQGEAFLGTLSEAGALLGRELTATGSVAVVVREDAGNPVRDRHALAHFERAWTCAREASWPEALRLADLAFVLSRGLVVERVALLALAMERQGRKTGGDGLIEMAAGSRGAEFGQRVRERRDELARACANASSSMPLVRARMQDIYFARDRALERDLPKPPADQVRAA